MKNSDKIKELFQLQYVGQKVLNGYGLQIHDVQCNALFDDIQLRSLKAMTIGEMETFLALPTGQQHDYMTLIGVATNFCYLEDDKLMVMEIEEQIERGWITLLPL